MTIPETPEARQFMANLERAHSRRQQRKLVDIDVAETSLVDRPAHLHEGWVVLKSASHSHRPDAQYVETDQDTTEFLVREAGFSKDACGCAYKVTPESTSKADQDAFREHLNQLQKATDSGAWSGMLTADQVKFLMGGKLEA